MSFIAAGAEILDDLVALRRDLHAHPEIGLDLPRTQAKVLQALDGLGLEVNLGKETTSVVAVLRGANPGPSVLLRGDMDALPVQELTGLEYASTNANMHACGHDLHTAALTGAARLLADRRGELAGNVIFMFQPGEEGYNGAGIMLGEGVLEAAGDKPVAAYAIHVGPGPWGVFATKSGPIMAGANELHITVNGVGGHGSQPHMSKDPVPPLVEIAAALQTMATRKFDAFDPVIITVTQLRGGDALNVIPESASLGATVRTLSVAATDKLAKEAKQLADGIAAAHGCTAEVEFIVSYPVTHNDPASAAHTLASLTAQFGGDRAYELPNAMMGSEDFSMVLQDVPGTFVFLHCSPEGTDLATAEFNHSPRVLFDDAVLGDQAAALAQLAYNHLSPSA